MFRVILAIVAVLIVVMPHPEAKAQTGRYAQNLMRDCLTALQAGLAFRQEEGETPLQACVRIAQQRVESGKAVAPPAAAVPVRRIGKVQHDAAAILPLLAPAAGAAAKDAGNNGGRTGRLVDDNSAFPAQNYYLQSGSGDGKSGAKPIFLPR